MCNLSEGIADRAERRGEKRGERRGEKRGERRGTENTWRASISSLMAKLDLTMQEAAKLLDVPADIQRKLQKS
jgi:predicted transposase YdaD